MPECQETSKRPRLALLAEIRRAGIEPTYGRPTLFHVRGNLLLVMMNHEYGVNATDAAKITEATMRARAEIGRIVRGPPPARRCLGRHPESSPPPSRSASATAAASVAATSSGREDLIRGARHEDAVVRATFPVDIHALTAEDNKNHALRRRRRESATLRHPFAGPHRQGRGRAADGRTLHQRRLHRPRQLPRHRQRRGHGRSCGRRGCDRRSNESQPARGAVERRKVCHRQEPRPCLIPGTTSPWKPSLRPLGREKGSGTFIAADQAGWAKRAEREGGDFT